MPAIDDLSRACVAQKRNIPRPIDYARGKSGSYEEERRDLRRPKTRRQHEARRGKRITGRQNAALLRAYARAFPRPHGDRERDALEEDSLGFEWPETIPGNAIHEVGAQRNFNARGSKNANEQAECCPEKTFAAEHDGWRL